MNNKLNNESDDSGSKNSALDSKSTRGSENNSKSVLSESKNNSVNVVKDPSPNKLDPTHDKNKVRKAKSMSRNPKASSKKTAYTNQQDKLNHDNQSDMIMILINTSQQLLQNHWKYTEEMFDNLLKLTQQSSNTTPYDFLAEVIQNNSKKYMKVQEIIINAANEINKVKNTLPVMGYPIFNWWRNFNPGSFLSTAAFTTREPFALPHAVAP